MTVLKYALRIAMLLAILGLYLFETHIELSFYRRGWVRRTIQATKPLGGCFDEGHISPSYNVTERIWGPKRTIVSGLGMRLGLDCYEFAGTIQARRQTDPQKVLSEDERTRFHTYWRLDLIEFGPRQEYMLQSFFATQHLPTSHLTLWTNGAGLDHDPLVRPYLERFPDSFAVREADIPTLARNTGLSRNLISVKDDRAWVDGDLIRLLLLWNYGGVWVDIDSLLTRDLEPLLDHEFLTQWDCYDKLYSPMNGALMHFHRHSPYLCEAFHLISHSPPPRPGTTDWGTTLYFRLWKSLLSARIPPFTVIPFCFSDGLSCRLDNRLPNPFKPDRRDGKWTMGIGVEEGGGLDEVLGKVFSVHLHNQWKKEFPKGGWVDRLLLRRYQERLNAMA